MEPSSKNTDDMLVSEKNVDPGDTPLYEVVYDHVYSYLNLLDIANTSGIYEVILQQVQKGVLLAALEKVDGNKSHASILLGINRGTLRKMIKNAGIEE